MLQVLNSITSQAIRGATTLSVATAVLAAAGGAALSADTYSFDKGHTEVRFEYNHVGLSTQSGQFNEFDGTVVFDKENLAASSIDVTIRIASIDTGVQALDNDLKSARFFEVEKHPTMIFKSTSVRQTGVDQGQVTGDLTIKGVTKPATLDVAFNFEGEHPLSPYLEFYKGAHYVAFSARGKILRSDWGIAMGAPLTADEIDIVIEAELRKTE